MTEAEYEKRYSRERTNIIAMKCAVCGAIEEYHANYCEGFGCPHCGGNNVPLGFLKPATGRFGFQWPETQRRTSLMKCLANNKTAAKLIDDQVNAIMAERINALVAAFALAMADKGECSVDTIRKVLEAVEASCEGIITGYITFADLSKTLKDEYNICLDTEARK